MSPALAPRHTSPEIAIALEVAGLMLSDAQSHSSRHTLLRPVNLRLVSSDALPEFRRRDYENERDQYLLWDSFEQEDVNAASTWPALWQLMRMIDASAEEIRAYTERWGMLIMDWDSQDGGGDPYGLDDPGDLFVGTWREFARFVTEVVSLIVLTAGDEFVSIEQLESLQDWDPVLNPRVEDLADNDIEHLSGSTIAARLSDLYMERRQRRWQRLLDERRSGEGVESQRRLAGNILDFYLGTQDVIFWWDERGRRIEREAFGLDYILYSHAATIFLSPEVDVLICSMCGTPYPFSEMASGRRPRFGTRRYCSDECRREGKRESNRQSWSRNSARWQRRATPQAAAKESFDGQAQS